MPCALALVASLAMADAYAVAPAARPAGSASHLAGEPLYADIIGRARTLKAEVLAIQALPDMQRAAAPVAVKRLAALEPGTQALAALDMKGHFDLEARKQDGDLKCILKGVSEDLPKKLAEVRAAKTGAAEYAALGELAYLLDDNVGVITAPPKPPV